jgi:hypothetical protein
MEKQNLRKRILTLIYIIIPFLLTAQTTTEKVSLQKLIIQDSNLVNILDSFIIQEPLHYNHDTIFLFVDVCNYHWKVGEECSVEDTMIVEISSTINKSFLFLTEKKGFIIYNNIYGTVQGILIPSLFTESNVTKIFHYEKEINPTIKLVSCKDFSWYFYYINGEFIHLNTHSK